MKEESNLPDQKASSNEHVNEEAEGSTTSGPPVSCLNSVSIFYLSVVPQHLGIASPYTNWKPYDAEIRVDTN